MNGLVGSSIPSVIFGKFMSYQELRDAKECQTITWQLRATRAVVVSRSGKELAMLMRDWQEGPPMLPKEPDISTRFSKLI